MRIGEATAPANIALIKYMGKIDAKTNRPANASISFTLDRLRTKVLISAIEGAGPTWQWRGLEGDGEFQHVPQLSDTGRSRFLEHAERVMNRILSWTGEAGSGNSFVIQSANNFPSDCGLASSASSFAALTLAVARLCDFDVESPANLMRLAEVAREGSGSSCRSFFSPWGLWDAEGPRAFDGGPRAESIRHLVFIVEAGKKAVSSSEAHRRVLTSLLFEGRVDRAEQRLKLVTRNLRKLGENLEQELSPVEQTEAWNEIADAVWAESWDMHALFETARPPFGYFTPGTIEVLTMIRDVSAAAESFAVGGFRKPIVTMDAGPNVHVLLGRDPVSNEIGETLKNRFQKQVIDSHALQR